MHDCGCDIAAQRVAGPVGRMCKVKPSGKRTRNSRPSRCQGTDARPQMLGCCFGPRRPLIRSCKVTPSGKRTRTVAHEDAARRSAASGARAARDTNTCSGAYRKKS